MTILDLLQLNEPQLESATASGDLTVTAGAGSGKTRTLVGRYLGLLESGVPMRAIIAITFTDKAAREMRTRIRQTIANWLQTSEVSETSEVLRAFWEEAFADLDASRIGTIHSLCAQILREQPVEAARLGHPPGFIVLEEGRAAVLRARAVEDALVWAAEDVAASQLFSAMGELGLRTAITTLLERRFDADGAFERLTDDPLAGWAAVLRGWLNEHLDDARWRGFLETLESLHADDPADGTSVDKMEIARQEVLAHAGALDAARRRDDLDATLAELAALRAATALSGRQANWPKDALETAKETMRALRAYFDEHLQPLADPKKPAAWALDGRVAGVVWALHAAYRRALASYSQAKRAEHGLDFDDLEAGALALLNDPTVRAGWQAAIAAVLVDEFQDTNERQRQIIYALSGFGESQSGDIFAVGDAKQSIYRFRGADVTVFRRVQKDVARSGGRAIALDLTFRAHGPLVAVTNRLLAPILDEVARPDRPYAVPFAPLEAHRSEPRPGIAPPFVEFLLGLGEPAGLGRQAAAEGLAARLLELHDREDVQWQDVALLFRASTAFPVYEDALERSGIPFITVAGRGFYDRYEVRDLLNALTAVADPTDDLALVGFLRSPAIGLTDAALYLLRFPPALGVPREAHQPCSVWATLNHVALPDIILPDELGRAVRGRELVAELHDLARRVPAAALLKRLLDRTHYRAALQAVEGGPRARRNVDKLLADAHASGLVSVREFLEYVRTLRDVGVRESEAPTEAGNAVQLMTVHKAKGLEFPIVVIADAAHAGHRDTATVRLDAQLGVVINLRDREGDRRPAAYRLAALHDAEQEEAEDRRLLYVAATRAREKLLLSAHTRILKGGELSLSGWLKHLGQVVGLDAVSVAATPIVPQKLALAQDVGCTLYPWREERPTTAHTGDQVFRPTPQASQGLVAPLTIPPSGQDPKLAAREAHPPRRVWRVVPRTTLRLRSGRARPHAPAWVVGTLVHTALRRWRFDEQGLEPFLRPSALEMGVVDEGEIHAAIVEARRMLRRFRAHSLWAEMDAAQRWHEASFTIIEDGRPMNGIVDLIYTIGGAWKIAEFKTDRLRSEQDLQSHIRTEAYDDQVQRYARCVGRQLGTAVEAALVFLNVGSEVAVVPIHLSDSEEVE